MVQFASIPMCYTLRLFLQLTFAMWHQINAESQSPLLIIFHMHVPAETSEKKEIHTKKTRRKKKKQF